MGKTCFYTHFGEAKALFSYIDLQVTDCVGGKTMQNFHLGAMPTCPLQVRTCRVPVVLLLFRSHQKSWGHTHLGTLSHVKKDNYAT